MTTGSDVRYLQQLDFPGYAVQLDWLMNDQNLIQDGFDLQSAVIVALGTDARAPDSEALPDLPAAIEPDRRGWWGDLDCEEIWQGWPVGCLLWLLRRAKITHAGSEQGSTLAKAEGWTREALRPFTERRITSRIDVIAEHINIDRIDVGAVIYRGPEPAVELRYADLWDALGKGDN
jgi:phage gp46-like protein